MAHSKLIIGRYNLFQVHFDFCRIVVRCKTYTLCNPLTVCINHNSRLTEYIAKYKVCCFSARSGKTCQVLHCIGYFPAVNVNKPLTAQDYIFRLVAVKSRRFYIFTKLVIIRICKIFCIPILFKKCFGNYINSCVGTFAISKLVLSSSKKSPQFNFSDKYII